MSGRVVLISVAAFLWAFPVGAACQQDPSPSCPRVESLKAPDDVAKEYAQAVVRALRKNWNGDYASPKAWYLVADIVILRDGELNGAHVVQSSGDRLTDQTATDTIHSSSPFASLPASLHQDCLTVGLQFGYGPRGGVTITSFDGVYRVGVGISPPRAIFSPDPAYSKEAEAAKYQGVCVLSLIIDPDGNPRDIKVVRHLEMGLDEKAIEAVTQWKFQPAMKDGRPVAVAINIEVNFRLR